jgi:hypothetical protein
MIEVPILSRLNHEKNARYCVNSVLPAIETLNRGLADQKIWNVEVNDAKFTLSNAVNHALDMIWQRWLDARPKDYRYEGWTDDFSMFCGFNQAAGRIKRLTKSAPKIPVIVDYIEALREVDAIWRAIQTLKPFVQKGRRPNENKTEEQIAEELRNTGICAICAHRQKLSDDHMVHHGYKMSDYNHAGYRVGKCFGTDYLCYELSNEANIAFAPVLADHLRGVKQALARLRSGDITEFEIEESEWNPRTRRADPKKMILRKVGTTADKFAREMESRIRRHEFEQQAVTSDIEINQAKIDNWKLKPLAYGR